MRFGPDELGQAEGNELVDSLETIRSLKSAGASNILAFVSHVQVDLKRQGQEAGADRVIARSAFSEKLNGVMSEAAATRDNEAECGIATGSPPDS